MISLQLSDFYDSACVLNTDISCHICNLLEILTKLKRLTGCKMDLKIIVQPNINPFLTLNTITSKGNKLGQVNFISVDEQSNQP